MHAAEMSVAQLTSIYINSQKTKPPYYKPQDFCLFAPRSDKLPRDLAEVIWSLKRDDLLVPSAAGWLPWEIIPPASDRPIAVKKELRILRTRGVWAIAPEIEENFLYVPLAIVEKYGVVQLNDPDIGRIYTVEIPKPSNILVQETWWLLLK